MAVQIPIISEFDATGIKKAVHEFRQLETTGAKAQYALKKAAVPAAAALAAVTVAMGDAVKGAIEDASAQKALAGQLQRVTGATDAQVAATEDWISAQGQAFGIADDQLRPALAKLATATKDVSRAQTLARTAMDIAAATGKDYESVVAALTKAELGQYASLKKLGLPLGDNTRALMDMAKETKAVHKAQTDLDNAMARNDKKDIIKATENLAKAQARLNAVTVEGADYVTDLNAAFGGAADEAATTIEGGFKRLSLAFAETKESVGAALLPVIEKVLPVLQRFADWAQKNPNAFLAIAGAITAVSVAIVAVNAAMALNPFSAIAAGVALLIVGLVTAYKKFEWFRDGIKMVVNSVLAYFETLINGWIMVINGVIRAWNLVPGHKDISTIKHITLGRMGDDNAQAAGSANIPKMAKGGLVTAPTMVLAGEAGPEAIVPLNRMRDMGGEGVTINVNGGDPQAVVDAITRWYRQNGPNVAWMR